MKDLMTKRFNILNYFLPKYKVKLVPKDWGGEVIFKENSRECLEGRKDQEKVK